MFISNQLRPRVPALLNIITEIGENPGLSGALPPDKPSREVRYIPSRQNDFKLSTAHITGRQPAGRGDADPAPLNRQIQHSEQVV